MKLPISNVFNTAARTVAVTAITGYQRFISPYKGFSCAHRVLYGCESCSQYFKRVIAEDGILVAITNTKVRFQECREANEILKERRAQCHSRRLYYASRLVANTMVIESGEPSDEEYPDTNAEPQEPPNPDQPNIGGSRWASKRRSQATNNGEGGNNWGNSNDCNDCANCADCADGMGVMDCDSLNCPDLNCDNADCLSGIDCSGCSDCGSLDCGGADCGSCG